MEVDYINAQNRLITQLAVERFNINSSRGETWITAVHDGRSVKKIMDKKYTLVSLPASEPADHWAMDVFAGQYNECTLRAADTKVRDGVFSEARETYMLLLRFACQGKGGWEQENIKKRLLYLDKIEKREDAADNLSKLMALARDYGAFTDLAETGTKTPTVVPNLLELESY